jgi:hypothetical protein
VLQAPIGAGNRNLSGTYGVDYEAYGEILLSELLPEVKFRKVISLKLLILLKYAGLAQW